MDWVSRRFQEMENKAGYPAHLTGNIEQVEREEMAELDSFESVCYRITWDLEYIIVNDFGEEREIPEWEQREDVNSLPWTYYRDLEMCEKIWNESKGYVPKVLIPLPFSKRLRKFINGQILIHALD